MDKKQNQSLDILKQIINNDLCTGCGVCAIQEGTGPIPMVWNNKGFLVPDLAGKPGLSSTSVKVCPFNPDPEKDVKTEHELAGVFLKNAPNENKKIGRFYKSYVGYSNTYRLTSSSGGLGTYLVEQLLKERIVDAVFAVTEGEDQHYTYKIIRREGELLPFSKTKYYPVSLAEVLAQLPKIEGKIAIVGIPCFIKAVRLHQYYNPSLKDKIAFLIGIICGGMKSRFFSEYLASKSGLNAERYFHPQYRIKNPESVALDYSFGCQDEQGEYYEIKMHDVGDMWGTGLFKNNACDFCDDVAAELADISLGDAWIRPYSNDGLGNNVVITRSALAEDLIQKGLERKELSLESLQEERFIESQQGGYNHRQVGMGYRVKAAKKKKMNLPPKRYENEPINFEFKLVQNQRAKVRALSLSIWGKTGNADTFDQTMKKSLIRLAQVTRGYHYIRRIRNVLKKMKL